MVYTTYSGPGYELKQELIKHLKNVCTFKHVIKFCDLLISGQEIIQQSKNIVPGSSDLVSELLQKADSNLEEVKDVIAAVSAEVLIQKLSEVLNTEFKPMEEKYLLSVLLKTIKSTKNSVKCLERLIYSIDGVVKLYWIPRSFSIFRDSEETFDKNFEELKRKICDKASYSGSTILDVILQIYLDNVEVSSVEKNEWRCLLLEAATAIEAALRGRCFMTLFRILQLRSGIQCILDLFAECPIQYDIFLKELDKIKGCVGIYDKRIEEMYEWFIELCSRNFSSCEYFSDTSYDLIDFGKMLIETDDDGESSRNEEKSMMSKMPVSHTWWQKFERKADIFRKSTLNSLCT